MKKNNELETESIIKLLLKFSIPSVVGLLVNIFYSIVDRIFVGRGVGSMALSGVAVTFPITNIIMAFAMLGGVGAAAVVSIKLGQHKSEIAEKVLGNTFVLLIVFSIFITVTGLIFLNPILEAFGASSETMPYAKDFATIILLGVIFQVMSMGLNNIIRAEGNPRVSMMTMLIGAIVNFIANPILIFGLGLGVRGSALSTVIAQFVSASWTIMYFTRGKSLLKLKKVNLKIDWYIVKQILAVGMSPFAMQLAASLVTITFNKSLESYGGDTAIGAMALINSVSMLILMPIFGINQGAQPIIGYNYGAKNYSRVKDTLKYSVIAATCITILGFIAIELFSVPIIKVFNNTDENLIQMGSQGLRILLIMLPIIGFAIVCTNYFQAIAKAKLSMILSLLRQVILLIPLIIILPNKFELKGVWMAQPIADLTSAIVVGIFIFKEIKGMKENEVKEIDILSA